MKNKGKKVSQSSVKSRLEKSSDTSSNSSEEDGDEQQKQESEMEIEDSNDEKKTENTGESIKDEFTKFEILIEFKFSRENP